METKIHKGTDGSLTVVRKATQVGEKSYLVGTFATTAEAKKGIAAAIAKEDEQLSLPL